VRRLLAVALAATVLSACGGSSGDSGAGPSAVADAMSQKPTVEVPDGPPPTELVRTDMVTGTGAEAASGKTVTVKYVGVTYADGKEFDSSWGKRDLTFQLGSGQVIPGWDNGIAGMKEGGRRQLVIPPELAYGPQGYGPIPPDATLVFVVDLVKVG
jgi:peptidylprolyl isomerase